MRGSVLELVGLEPVDPIRMPNLARRLVIAGSIVVSRKAVAKSDGVSSPRFTSAIELRAVGSHHEPMWTYS